MSRKMKYSGVKWIGDIPEEWSIAKTKYLVNSIKSGGTPDSSNQEYYCDEGIPFVSISDMSQVDYIYKTQKYLTIKGVESKKLTIYEQGTILYSIYATLGKVAELKVKATINQAILALVINEKINKSFFKYNLNAMEDYIINYSNGNTQYNLNAEKVKNFDFVLPILDEQQQIANYLDKKVSLIDTIISKQKTLIEKYKAYKQSLITETVTKGLNKDVPMKDSGIEWIGEIPSHWESKKIKLLTNIILQKVEVNKLKLYLGLENVECWSGKIISYSKTDNLEVEKGSVFYKGNVLFGKLRPYLAKCVVTNDTGICSDEFLVLEPVNIDAKLLKYMMLSRKFIDLINSLTYGVKMPRANWSLIGNIELPLCNIEEQKEIADFLDKKCNEIDSIISKKEQLIEKLESYKKSLIYECVTGKREVN